MTPCAHGIAIDCERCWWIRTHEHRFDLFAPEDAVCSASECTVTRGRAIEREAQAIPAGGSVEALRAALDRVAAAIDDPKRYTYVNRDYRSGWVDALRAVRDEAALPATPPSGGTVIDVELLADAYASHRNTGHYFHDQSEPCRLPCMAAVAAEYTRLASESSPAALPSDSWRDTGNRGAAEHAARMVRPVEEGER